MDRDTPTRPAVARLLPDPAATDALGVRLAGTLRRGDTVLLSGPVGAGKSHLARAILRHWLGPVAEVPSPTFTLVQTYDTPGGPAWHVDLYRLSSVTELDELGLDAALGRDICLIEWPERLGPLAPADALRLTLAVEGEGRRVTARGGRDALRAAVGNG